MSKYSSNIHQKNMLYKVLDYAIIFIEYVFSYLSCAGPPLGTGFFLNSNLSDALKRDLSVFYRTLHTRIAIQRKNATRCVLEPRVVNRCARSVRYCVM
jgi:hypothetical protein